MHGAGLREDAQTGVRRLEGRPVPPATAGLRGAVLRDVRGYGSASTLILDSGLQRRERMNWCGFKP